MENKRGESMSELMGKVIKELEHVFDVLSFAIKNNRERIVELEKRIKEIEDTFIIKEDK
jgi:hypothetical protein